MRKLWFRRSFFGWAWVPSSWEGWVVAGFFLLVIVSVVGSFTRETSLFEMGGSLVVPVLLLIAICYMTGEK